jgi:hypothetical protein
VIPQQISAAFVLMMGLSIAGCASAPPKPVAQETTFTQPSPPPKPAEEPAATSEPAAEPPPPASGPASLNDEQRKQMEIALKRGSEKASQCPISSGIEDAPRGEGEVKVTFDGQKGRVTDVTVGAPWAGTPIESCIKRSFIGEIIVPFEGEPLEVPYTVKLPPKPEPADKKKKKK